MDGYDGYGDGDAYGNGGRTRDFFSQADAPSAAGDFNIFSDSAAVFPTPSTVSAQRQGLSALALNSGADSWPGLEGYESLLRSGQEERGVDGGMNTPPVRRGTGVVTTPHGRRVSGVVVPAAVPSAYAGPVPEEELVPHPSSRLGLQVPCGTARPFLGWVFR
jgi:hypothetical protein